MCPIQFRRDGPPYGPPAFLAFDDFTALLDQFPAIRELQLQGLGEPLMHPRFFDMVRYARARNIDVSVNTNLTYITPQKARECVASGLSRLHASIDGATAQTYEAIRVQANYAKVVRNLHRVLAARREAQSATPRIELVYVVMRRNLEELPQFAAQAAAWGVDALSVQHLCHDFAESTLPEHYRAMRDFVERETLLNENPDRIETIFGQARRAAGSLTLRLPTFDVDRPARMTGKPGCSWPWKGAYFSYKGEAMPCCMVSTPDRVSLGNAVRDGVETVWNGEEYVDFRTALSGDKPPEICRSCAVYNGTF